MLTPLKLGRVIRYVLAIGILGTGALGSASTPDWLRRAAKAPLPKYPEDTKAILLLDETTITVSQSGEVHKTYRKAYKILRPQARTLGTVGVYFDSDTRLTFLKGWSITAKNEEYEVKEKDAIETSALSEGLYSDTRYKLLLIPGSQPGSVIGYEYQQKQRPFTFQSVWPFQSEIPVLHSRFVLELPRNWGFQQYWRNHTPLKPQQDGDNRWVWEVADVEAVASEAQMPSWQSLAGCLGVSFASNAPDKSQGSWDQIAHWYWDLASSQRVITPAIRAKTQELVAGAPDDMEKIRRLASYVQHRVRYVAIEIGIGGYQPHPAQQVFASGYGDCKDKATLLATMLSEIGVDSYYVLINDDRDYTLADFPNSLSFDHVILAVRLPENLAHQFGFSKLVHAKMGTLLLFDPTDPSTPFGYLPPALQGADGLLVMEKDGGLIKMPLHPPLANRLLRTGTLDLDRSGNLKGTVTEVRSGPAAAQLAERLTNLVEVQRQKVFEDLLSDLIDGAILTKAAASGIKDFTGSVSITYSFTMSGYAQHAGDLFLFRPCAVCRKASDILEGKPRKYPLVFSHTTSESDVFDISYPSDLVVDEFPHAVSHQYAFASYKSETQTGEHLLHYQRTYLINEVRASLDQLDGFKMFFRKIAADEGAYVVLKTAAAK